MVDINGTMGNVRRIMKNTAEVIEFCGGPATVAHWLSERYKRGFSPKTVSAWKGRQNIPLDYWLAIIEMSKGLVSPDILVKVHCRHLPLAKVARRKVKIRCPATK